MTKKQKLIKFLYEIYSDMSEDDIELILDLGELDALNRATRLFVYDPFPYCDYLSDKAVISPTFSEYSDRYLQRVLDWSGQNWANKDFVIKMELLVS